VDLGALDPEGGVREREEEALHVINDPTWMMMDVEGIQPCVCSVVFKLRDPLLWLILIIDKYFALGLPCMVRGSRASHGTSETLTYNCSQNTYHFLMLIGN